MLSACVCRGLHFPFVKHERNRVRDASGTVSKRVHEACHVTAIFKEMWRSGGSKAHFFLASQGRRLRPARPCASRPARPRFPDLTWFCSHIFEFRHKNPTIPIALVDMWRRVTRRGLSRRGAVTAQPQTLTGSPVGVGGPNVHLRLCLSA